MLLTLFPVIRVFFHTCWLCGDQPSLWTLLLPGFLNIKHRVPVNLPSFLPSKEKRQSKGIWFRLGRWPCSWSVDQKSWPIKSVFASAPFLLPCPHRVLNSVLLCTFLALFSLQSFVLVKSLKVYIQSSSESLWSKFRWKLLFTKGVWSLNLSFLGRKRS